ncbi:reverse transcriptase domain-containing protein [Tanacetum coccineum]
MVKNACFLGITTGKSETYFMGSSHPESPVVRNHRSSRRSPSRRDASPARHRSSHSARSPVREKPPSRTKSPRRGKSPPTLSPVRQKPSSHTKRPRSRSPLDRSSKKETPSTRTRSPVRADSRSPSPRSKRLNRDRFNHKDEKRHDTTHLKKESPESRSPSPRTKRLRRAQAEMADKVTDRGHERNHGGEGDKATRKERDRRNDDDDAVARMKAAEEALETKEKQKPSFELSGKLAAETNRVKGVTLLFTEPPDARKPDIRWRFYVFKGGESFNDPLYVHRQTCYLFGRERRVADIPTDHPSCSKQHAVLQYRQVDKELPDGMLAKEIKPYIMDLGSTNGTFINGNRIEAERYYELMEQDTVKFGNSRKSSQSLGLVQDLVRTRLEVRNQPVSSLGYDETYLHHLDADRDIKEEGKEMCSIAEPLSESEDNEGGHWKSKSRKQKSSIKEEDLSQPWTCEEADPFTPRIRYFELPKKSRMPNNVKTYDESDDPKDHLKIFQAAAKVERWAMPTWCHMFNSTLNGSTRKCNKDLVEIHHIKQREGESTKDFVQSRRDDKGNHNVSLAAFNQARKKAPPTWKQQEVGRKQNFNRMRDFRNQQRSERRHNKFTLLTRSPKEILAIDKGKFKASPPMTTHVEKRNRNKFCEFHGEVGHNTNECMHLKRQIEALIKNGKLSHVIKELKQGSGKDQPKTAKKGETSGKDKPLAILMALSGSEKPNDSSYRTPHWRQWRNHMANGTNIAASKNRRCGAFHLYMDEFCGSKITVSIQWDHMKARRILTLWSSRIIPLECTMVSGPEARPFDIIQAVEERIKVAIHPEYPEQTIAIGSTLTEEGRKALSKHRLNVREGCSPVRQNKRSRTPERNKAIPEEVEKLVDADILKEVHYHSWLSNPVMVKKHDDNRRMCVDFKDLNKACPKNGYPLPEIDWKVESLCGYPFKCFLDAYKGYHQIKMAKEDEEKTTFITSQGVFCYSKMPFGLKNVVSTYQRLVDKAFQKQIGKNLEKSHGA